MMNTPVAQARIAREIQEAEEALNGALLTQSQLFTSLVVARRDLAVAPFTGQDALMRLTKSQQSLLSAGGDLARVHGRMLEINQQVRGDVYDECPPTGLAPADGVAA